MGPGDPAHHGPRPSFRSISYRSGLSDATPTRSSQSPIHFEGDLETIPDIPPVSLEHPTTQAGNHAVPREAGSMPCPLHSIEAIGA